MSTLGKPPRGLGRGLDALLPSVRSQPSAPEAPAPTSTGSLLKVPVERIRPQRDQPRRRFDTAALDELSKSIEQHGILEPLLVRRVGPDAYEIVAGERRWRAAQRAGLLEVPVVLREASDQQAFELALIENVQREDLNSIELAEALRRLVDEFSYTQEALATRIGKDRSTIANVLRLLKLPESVRKRALEGDLSEGHARALLPLDEDEAEAVAERVIRGKLSVRETESLVKEAKRKAGGRAPKEKSVGVKDLEHRLERKLGARCQVRDKSGKGEISIQYGSLDELDRILDLILR